jgi:hypothetical protein
MKRAILTVVVLLALAACTVPAMAVPAQHKATWGGWGVTTNYYDIPGFEIGDTVYFAGQAQQAADGTLWGEASFEGTYLDAPIEMHLNIDSGYFSDYFGLMKMIQVGGLADVTFMGETQEDLPFEMAIATWTDGTEGFYLSIGPIGWYVFGPDAMQGNVKIA